MRSGQRIDVNRHAGGVRCAAHQPAAQCFRYLRFAVNMAAAVQLIEHSLRPIERGQKSGRRPGGNSTSAPYEVVGGEDAAAVRSHQRQGRPSEM